MIDALAFFCAATALLPMLMTLANHRHFQVLAGTSALSHPLSASVDPAPSTESGTPLEPLLPLNGRPPGASQEQAGQGVDQAARRIAEISVLIPARNEAARIAATLEAVLRSDAVQWEVVVLNDQSQDRTAEIVRSIAACDPRVRLVDGRGLPAGWNGKQYACWQLAEAAASDILVFLDADVRLAPDALRRIAHRMSASPELGLLSLFPWQQTVTLWEKLLVPLMHFILLGFLPIAQMRRNCHPAFAAGCGQLMVARREAYRQCGGHAAIRGSRHDGIMLPRLFRRHGWRTDIADGQDVAACRMYESAREVFRGVVKNATEGIAHPRLIVFFTITLLAGAFLPWILLPIAITAQRAAAVVVLISSIAFAYAPRVINTWLFRQSWTGALLHPVSILIFLLLQWVALFGSMAGWRPQWKGRTS